MNRSTVKKALAAMTLGIACVVSQAPLAQGAKYFNASTAKASAVMDASGEVSSSVSGNVTYITAGNQGVTNLLGFGGTNTLVFYMYGGQDKIPTATNVVMQPEVAFTNHITGTSLVKPMVVGPYTLYVKKVGTTQERLYVNGKKLTFSTLNWYPFVSVRPAYTNAFVFGKSKGNTLVLPGSVAVYKGLIVAPSNQIFSLKIGGFGSGTFTPLPNGAATFKVIKATGPDFPTVY